MGGREILMLYNNTAIAVSYLKPLVIRLQKTMDNKYNNCG